MSEPDAADIPPERSYPGPSKESPGMPGRFSDATPLCSNCLAGIDRYTRFFPRCQAPVCGLVTYDPYHFIGATGWLFRKMLRGPVHAPALVATWLIFGPLFLGNAFGLLSVFMDTAECACWWR